MYEVFCHREEFSMSPFQTKWCMLRDIAKLCRLYSLTKENNSGNVATIWAELLIFRLLFILWTWQTHNDKVFFSILCSAPSKVTIVSWCQAYSITIFEWRKPWGICSECGRKGLVCVFEIPEPTRYFGNTVVGQTSMAKTTISTNVNGPFVKFVGRFWSVGGCQSF